MFSTDGLVSSEIPITADGARVNGTITDPDVDPNPYQVEYGTTTAYGQKTAEQQTAKGGGAQRVSITLTGLKAATTYHARLVSRFTTLPGEDVVFKTAGSAAPPPPAPPPATAATHAPRDS